MPPDGRSFPCLSRRVNSHVCRCKHAPWTVWFVRRARFRDKRHAERNARKGDAHFLIARSNIPSTRRDTGTLWYATAFPSSLVSCLDVVRELESGPLHAHCELLQLCLCCCLWRTSCPWSCLWRGSEVKANVSSENNEKGMGKGSGIGQQDELIGHFATLCISINRRIRTFGRLSCTYLCHQRRVHEDRCCFAVKDIAGRRKLMKDKHMMYLSLPLRRSRL